MVVKKNLIVGLRVLFHYSFSNYYAHNKIDHLKLFENYIEKTLILSDTGHMTEEERSIFFKSIKRSNIEIFFKNNEGSLECIF